MLPFLMSVVDVILQEHQILRVTFMHITGSTPSSPIEDVPDVPEQSVADIDAAKKKKHHIFDNDYVSTLCRHYQQHQTAKTYQRIIEHTSNLIDTVIRAHKFHLSAPFADIRNNMFLHFKGWVMNWDPSPGAKPLYSYVSACCRNAALSYITAEKRVSDRILYEHAHQTPLDAFDGCHYNERFDKETKEEIRKQVGALEARWKEPIIIEIIRYCVGLILRGRANDKRQQVLRTIVTAYPVKVDDARFLLDWSLGAVRQCVINHYDSPLGEADVLRAAYKFSFLPDIVNTIGIAATQKLMAVLAGITVKFPSPTQVRQISTIRLIHEHMKEDVTPNGLVDLSRRLKIPVARVQEIYDDTCANQHAGVLEDRPVYPDGVAPDTDELDE